MLNRTLNMILLMNNETCRENAQSNTVQKMKFSIKDFISKTADLVTFTERILNRKLHFLCNVCFSFQAVCIWKIEQSSKDKSYNLLLQKV